MSTKNKNTKAAPKLSTSTNKAKLSTPSKFKDGDGAKVSTKTGYSASHVSNVLAGRRYNAEIINTFNSLWARRK